jgi:Type III restriction enzyme, res subunit
MTLDLDALLANLALDREHQMRAVRATLQMLLEDGRRGVVLADEVGCGKTFEALGAAALLWKHFHGTATPIQRILIVAEPALITKWFTEIEAPADAEKGGKGRGFPQYVQGEKWRGFQALLRNACRLRSPRDGAESGVREDGRIQVQPNRIYIAKPGLLTGEREGSASPTVRWLRRTSWDLVIVDEAHHYARLHTKTSRVFFPEQTPESREGGLRARFLLALTATPFQLSTTELLNLLRVIEASPEDVDILGRALPKYERALESFYASRRFAPGEEARERWVKRLDDLRTKDALGGDRPNSIPGLQDLFRRYIIRNVKDAGLRDYGLAEKRDAEIGSRTFAKLDDLKPLVQKSPLIPLEGEHAFVYLSLRDLVDDAARAAREDENERPTFISGDLRQCLSSYSQLRASSLVQKNLKRAGDVVRALDKLTEAKLEHPKVEALCRVVDRILSDELARVRANPSRMPQKIVVFNTLLKTARELRDALERTASARIGPFVDEMLTSVGWSNRQGAEQERGLALRRSRARPRDACRYGG